METNLEKSAALGNFVFEEKITKSSSFGEEKDNLLESAKSKLGEVKQENERLKQLLSQIVKDYQSLQMRFLDILQQEEANEYSFKIASSGHQANEESDLVSLSLGRGSGSHEHKKEEKKSSNLIINGKEDEKPNHIEGLELGLECKFETAGSTEREKNPSSESSLVKPEEEVQTEIWLPSKILKTMRSGDDEDVSEQMQLKKARVSVRARCDTPTMNDGCRWRKYGQKIAKGNPCPRAYYRCTVSPTCPVRKQVQRCAKDMSILITTYEGNHNHPLPLSATAMASTTSAAASMLQSQSSSSQPGVGTSFTAPSTSSAANLHGLNFKYLAQNSRPYYYSISNSNSQPTVTLDLTSSANSSYFSRLANVPRYLNFCSSPSSSLEGSKPQTSWNTSHLITFGAFPNHKDSFIGSLNPGREPPKEQYLSESITAATKAITSNPSFCSALASALTSFVGNGGDVPRDNISGNESLPHKTAHPAAVDNEVGSGASSSYLGKSSSMNPQQRQKQASLQLFPTSLAVPTSKSASDLPADHSNHIK